MKEPSKSQSKEYFTISLQRVDALNLSWRTRNLIGFETAHHVVDMRENSAMIKAAGVSKQETEKLRSTIRDFLSIITMTARVSIMCVHERMKSAVVVTDFVCLAYDDKDEKSKCMYLHVRLKVSLLSESFMLLAMMTMIHLVSICVYNTILILVRFLILCVRT